MDIVVTAGPAHYAEIAFADWRAPCALGAGGVRRFKTEGDGATPLGRFLLRQIYWRRDRWPAFDSAFDISEISQKCGWSDAPADPAYNQYVGLPYGPSHEMLHRADGLYDVFFTLGYNDQPAWPGLGSAIFLHLQKNRFQPTRGCIAVDAATMTALLARAQPGDAVVVQR